MVWTWGLIAIKGWQVCLARPNLRTGKVMLSFELGYNLWTMFLTRVNSERVKGSKGWGWWLETSEKMCRDRSKKSISFKVVAMVVWRVIKPLCS